MKKFYFLAVSLLLSIAATAASLTDAVKTPSLKNIGEFAPTRIAKALPSNQAKGVKAPAKAAETEWSEWSEVGTGVMTMDDQFGLFTGMTQWEGDFPGIVISNRKSLSDETIQQYKFSGIYNDADMIFDYDATTGAIEVQPQSTGIMSEDWGAEILAVDAGTGYGLYAGPDYGSAEDIQAIVDMYHAYNYFIPEIGRFYVYMGYTIEGINDFIAIGDITIQIDGYPDYTPQIKMASFYKTAIGVKADFTFPEDAVCNYAFFDGYMTQSQINKVLAGGEGIETLEKSGSVTFDAPHNGVYALVAITFNKAGKELEWGYAQFSVNDPEAGKWKSIGKAKVTVDIIETLFGKDVAEYEVEIENNIANPAKYRVIDLYGEAYPLEYDRFVASDFTHYLEFDCTDPTNVVVKTSNIGIDMGGDWFMVISQDEWYKQAGRTNKKPVYGTFADNVIDFPQGSIMTSCDAIENLGGVAGAWYDGKLNVKISGTSGIESITVNDSNAPVEYFNLQGIRVAEPVEGQLYIRRQGKTVSKQIVR